MCSLPGIMGKNLFIVNTPYHLLTSYIIANSICRQSDNYLALIHPHGYEKWQNAASMRFLASKAGNWQEVFYLLNWLSHKNKSQTRREQANYVREKMRPIGFDNIFLGSDIDPQNQLLVAALGKDSFCRYEDGLFSYYNEDRRRPLTHEVFHRLKLNLLAKAAGISTKLAFNTSTASDSKAGICDYMYAPELLARPTPKAYAIEEKAIARALNTLDTFLKPTFDQKVVLFLSQPLVEKGWYTLEQEFSCLKETLSSLPKEAKLLYKPHPNDNPAKIDFYRANFPQLEIYENVEPAEIIFAREDNLEAVVSYQSTALLYPQKFAARPLRSISLSDFGQSPVAPPYKSIMKKAGVKFPASLEEIAAIMRA